MLPAGRLLAGKWASQKVDFDEDDGGVISFRQHQLSLAQYIFGLGGFFESLGPSSESLKVSHRGLSLWGSEWSPKKIHHFAMKIQC